MIISARLAALQTTDPARPAGEAVAALDAAPGSGSPRHLLSLRAGVLGVALTLTAVVCAIAIGALDAMRGWEWHAVYRTALGWAFVFWNSVRILTYVPTVRLLLKPGASAEHYSVATWSSWVLSNGTMALYLFEASGRGLNSLVLLNAGNTVMCLITCALIIRLQHRPLPAAEATETDAPLAPVLRIVGESALANAASPFFAARSMASLSTPPRMGSGLRTGTGKT